VAVGLAWAFEVRPEGAPQHSRDAAAPEPVGEERLDGWKRIAAYLNRDVRTVRRWEKQQGLPVRRLMHDKLATVYAYRSELDGWLRQRDTAAPAKASTTSARQSKPALRWAWLAVPAALAVGYLAWWSQQAEDQPIAFGEWDWVLITHFDNRTGEEMLEGMMEYALERELSNSLYVKVATQERINAALDLMKRPPDSPVDVETGREISLRDGGIKILIGGRIERLGSTYLISTQLINPIDGVALASFTSEATGEDSILPSVRQLGEQVRAALGESLSSIQASAEMLAKATTPSLQALKLYSEAEQMMRGGDRSQAVSVLEQAIRIDPDFASAHLLLVYVLRDRNEAGRAREHLERAVELAEQTSERERLFILATYYRYLGDVRREIETYELLTRLYPDHLWANGNLGRLLAWQGRLADAYPYKLRQVEADPNDEWPKYNAAQFAVINGERETAERLIEQAALLADYPWFNARLMVFPAHAAWVEGDYAEALRLVETIIGSREPEQLVSFGPLFAHVRSLLQALGRLDRLREVTRFRGELGWLDAIVDFDSGNRETLDGYGDGNVAGYWDAVMLAMAGRTDEARRLIDDPRTADLLHPAYKERDWRNLADGWLALAEGRYQEAKDRLGADPFYLNFSARHADQLAMHGLARAYLGLGQADEAIKTLESTWAQGPLTIFEPGAAWFWMRNQVMLHRLYVDSGRDAEAAVIAAELGRMLTLADADHPFLSALHEAGSE
jgi:tetratricopeptide (TPR) repeat protein